MIITTEQAHSNLKNLLLNGRVLVNGLPLTANELSAVIMGEQMLFEKAMQLDKTSALVAKQRVPTKNCGKVVKLHDKNPPESATKKKD